MAVDCAFMSFILHDFRHLGWTAMMRGLVISHYIQYILRTCNFGLATSLDHVTKNKQDSTVPRDSFPNLNKSVSFSRAIETGTEKFDPGTLARHICILAAVAHEIMLPTCIEV